MDDTQHLTLLKATLLGALEELVRVREIFKKSVKYEGEPVLSA